MFSVGRLQQAIDRGDPAGDKGIDHVAKQIPLAVAQVDETAAGPPAVEVDPDDLAGHREREAELAEGDAQLRMEAATGSRQIPDVGDLQAAQRPVGHGVGLAADGGEQRHGEPRVTAPAVGFVGDLRRGFGGRVRHGLMGGLGGGVVSRLRFGRVEPEPAHGASAERPQPSASRLPGAGRTWVTTAAA